MMSDEFAEEGLGKHRLVVPVRSPEELAWENITNGFAEEGLALIFTEYFNPCTTIGGWPSGVKAVDLTREKALSYPHLLLPLSTGSAIRKIMDDMDATRQNYERATAFGNAFWMQYLTPLAASAKRLVESKQVH